MSTILGALHFFIKSQVSSRSKSPKTGSELILFALQVESTRIFNSSSFSSSKENEENRNKKEDHNARSHLGMRNRDNETNSLGFSNHFPLFVCLQTEHPVICPLRNHSKIKCFNCDQYGYVLTNCDQPCKDPIQNLKEDYFY